MIRKTLAAAAAAASLLTLAPGQAEGARTVEGSILVPTTRDANSIYFAPPPGPIAKHARCVYLAARDATGDGNSSNGLVGYHIDLSEAEGDGNHTYTLTSSAGDIGIYFYEDLGVCEGNAASTGEGTAVGNEAGTVPFYSQHAIIVVEEAADIDFTFTISPGA